MSSESRPLKKDNVSVLNHLSFNMSNNVSPRLNDPIRTRRKGREEEGKRHIDHPGGIRRIVGRYTTGNGCKTEAQKQE